MQLQFLEEECHCLKWHDEIGKQTLRHASLVDDFKRFSERTGSPCKEFRQIKVIPAMGSRSAEKLNAPRSEGRLKIVKEVLISAVF
ncbi:MAG: hypothetical protein V2I51_19680 [Anderseniella sp.]|jgi:hypothetical protein|nr:hypothetical protein [Anderseniella sp.]